MNALFNHVFVRRKLRHRQGCVTGLVKTRLYLRNIHAVYIDDGSTNTRHTPALQQRGVLFPQCLVFRQHGALQHLVWPACDVRRLCRKHDFNAEGRNAGLATVKRKCCVAVPAVTQLPKVVSWTVLWTARRGGHYHTGDGKVREVAHALYGWKVGHGCIGDQRNGAVADYRRAHLRHKGPVDVNDPVVDNPNAFLVTQPSNTEDQLRLRKKGLHRQREDVSDGTPSPLPSAAPRRLVAVATK
jgi:hypothetical protein